ncbi:MAG: addiction module protein [Spirochaetota bacterium]
MPSDNLLKEALSLKPVEKADLIDKLLSSLDKPDKEIDKLWAKEVENRINAYDRGEAKVLTLEDVLKKYK